MQSSSTLLAIVVLISVELITKLFTMVEFILVLFITVLLMIVQFRQVTLVMLELFEKNTVTFASAELPARSKTLVSSR